MRSVVLISTSSRQRSAAQLAAALARTSGLLEWPADTPMPHCGLHSTMFSGTMLVQ